MTLTACQRWTAVLGFVAVIALAQCAPYEFTAHSEFDRVRGLSEHWFSGVVYAPVSTGPEPRTAPIGPTWVFEAGQGVDTLDTVHLDVARFATWLLMTLALTIDAVLAAESKPRRRRTSIEPPHRMQQPIRSARYLVMPVLVQVLTAYVLASWYRRVEDGVWRIHNTVGLLILVPSAMLWMAARYQLGNAFTGRAEARTLVTDGVYARLRHPIYVSAELTWAGVIVFLGKWYLAALWLIAIPVQVRRARREARILEATFGERYRAYMRRTWF